MSKKERIKNKTLSIWLLCLTLISLFVVPQFSIPVKAEVKTFKVEDSFEDRIRNKVYSQYDNITITDTRETYSHNLYPNLNNVTQLTRVGAGTNWDCVNDIASDEDTTYVRTSTGAGWLYDYYRTQNPSFGFSYIIENVTLHTRVRQVVGGSEDAKFYFFSKDTAHSYDITPTVTYATYTYTMTVHPDTGTAWTVTQLNDINIGVGLLGSGSDYPRCTQTYVSFYYTNGTYNESFDTEIEQETTIYTAYSGLKSFIYDKGNYQNASQTYSHQYRNASIIIDIDFLEIFPESIKYLILSDVQTNLSLVLVNQTKTEKFLLESTNNQSSFRRVRESINREEFLLNESVDSYSRFYFEIDFNSSTPIYLDDLELLYTDAIPTFSHRVRSSTDADLSSFDYLVTETFFNLTSGTLTAATGNLYYAVESNNFFTRRIFTEYQFRGTKDAEIVKAEEIKLFHEVFLHIDQTYQIQTYMRLFPYTSGGEYRMTWQFITVVYVGVTEVFYDIKFGQNYEQINDSYAVDFKPSIYFETEESLKITAQIDIIDNGNSSTFDYSLPVNTELPKNTLSIANMTNAVLMERASVDFAPKYSGRISRSITHSSEQPLVEPVVNFFNNLNWDSPLGALLNVLTFPFRFTIGIVKFCVKVYQVIAILTNLVNVFKKMFSEFTGEENLGDIIGSNVDIDGALSDNLDNMFDGIDTDVQNNLNSYGVFGDMGDIWDDYEARDWGNLDSSFGGVFPDVDYNLINSNENLANGFWSGILGFGISDVWTPSMNVVTNIVAYITLFIILFFMSIMFRLLKGDFDSLIRDASRLFHAVQFVINAIIRIFEWIFEIISLILNVAIPFT